MPPYQSFVPIYWRTWIFSVAVYVASTFLVGSPAKFLGAFAFITIFGAVFVFAFEFSRLKSFLNKSFPDISETFPHTFAFSFFTFFHPFYGAKYCCPPHLKANRMQKHMRFFVLPIFAQPSYWQCRSY